MKRELKVGQRVRVYESSGIWDGTVENVNTKIGPGVTVEFKDGPRGFTRTVFAEQCRRLRRRERSEKRERVERTLHVSLGIETLLPRDGAPPPYGKYRLVELRAGEAVVSRADLEKAWEQAGDYRGSCFAPPTDIDYLAKLLGLGAE